MRSTIILLFGLITLLTAGCVSLGKLSRHDFDSGFYKLKVPGSKSSHVYTEVAEDSVIVFPLVTEGKKEFPNTSMGKGLRASRVKTDNYFFKSTFIRNSLDLDLTSILFKSRHSRDDVPNQFSADFDIALYLGFRKDFYKIVSPLQTFNQGNSKIRQIGFDLGVFAGIGSTPVNPTVTNSLVPQTYDAMIFQKGIAGFISINSMSFGLALGYDNLFDKNKSYWIYNQKSYIGLIISISDF
jgi:hypothetical protein